MNIKEQIEEILLTDYQYVDCYTVQKLLDLFAVSGRSGQLVCTFCGINPITEVCKHPKVCSTKEKLKQTN
jgi:hypothetical protein